MEFEISGLDKSDEKYRQYQLAAQEYYKRIVAEFPKIETEKEKVRFYMTPKGIQVDFSNLSQALLNQFPDHLSKG